MPIAASLLPEFDNEMKNTRALLARVPDALASWKPHAKSMTMGQLAIHLPGLVSWVPAIMSGTELDVTGPMGREMNPAWESQEKMLAAFDAALPAARAAIAGATDDALMVPWTLKAGSHVVFTMPRVAVLRTAVMNHIIHHRGQLGVYLRINDVPLPEIYGPTADSARF